MKTKFILAFAVCGLGLAGCLPVQNLQTDDAALARRILAEHCVVGKLQLDNWFGYELGENKGRVGYIRQGKVSKRSDAIFFHHVNKMHAARIYVYSVKDLPDGWVIADAAYEGHRENVYFNRRSAEFTCSTDEWRTVRSHPESRTFETSPLIVTAAPRTAH